MKPDSEPVATADQASVTPRQQRLPATPREDSRMSVQTLGSTASGREYLDSLVPPSAEEFQRISHLQEEREVESRRRSHEIKRRSIESRRSGDYGAHADERANAARVIQRTFRGYRARREIQGHGLDASTRWVSAIKEAQYRELIRPRARSNVTTGDGAGLGSSGGDDSRPSTAKGNWRKAAVIAKRANCDDVGSDHSLSSLSSSSNYDSDPRKRAEAKKRREEATERRKREAQMMGLQYFLEMVDLKHRYGSNLRIYHEEWKKSDTHENFFYWLDYGEGKTVEMDACTREQLEREQVRYLSREERQDYLVTVDNDGRLCWSKNGARIDTTTAYKDSIHGIVPASDETEAWVPPSQTDLEPRPHVRMHVHPPRHHRERPDDDTSSTDSSAESELEEAEARRYATPEFDNAKGVKKVSHLSASTIFNKLLRKSVKKNTWIFVADTSFRLYVGIKNSGAFQHSSFLQGSRISAAGLIKIKNGRLTSLSPLSGHYRPPAASFRAFVHSLKEEGVDMSHVSISKSYGVLVGLEAYVKTRKKGKEMLARLTRRKDKIVRPEEVRRWDEEGRDKSESAETERKILQREEEEREENKSTVKFMQKMHLSAREPERQRES